MAMQISKKAPEKGIETSDYIKRLLHMTDQLRIAEQKVTMSIEREIESIYKKHQYAVNTGFISIDDLNKEKP
ncbi:hypothetical protein [Lentibacillus sp. JNUCC-1]|uniref:hypothetical protein n=1 Tax=Lentibacillus sp. JNUCC-1 TaxID=2654513 RepID=UPI0012E80730|nr:hypothetical protein [Lentibacillus sp. JNUCC-1]